jgi:adenine deaminase
VSVDPKPEPGALLPPRLRLAPLRRRRLVAVARGLEPADLVVRGGLVLNVYTGRLEAASIGIAEGRVAWVGDERPGTPAAVLDVDGATVVPGLVEPHGHPDVLTTPSAFATALALRGTTSVSVEAHELLLALSDEELLAVVAGLDGATTKLFWRMRPERDAFDADPHGAIERAARILRRLPQAVGVGELTGWPWLAQGHEPLERLIETAHELRLQVEGHLPGASAETLGYLASAGLTSDHEAIDGRQLVDAVAAGYWVMLRSSSLRRDAAALARHLVDQRIPLGRVLLTTDGPVAADLARAAVDGVVRELIAEGIDPVDVVRMATLAPATYLGLDAHLGGIAPGRCADLLVVDSLTSFRPRTVVADGREVTAASVSGGDVDWSRYRTGGLVAAPLTAAGLRELAHAGPALRMRGVITRATERGPDDALALLVARDGSWATGCTIACVETDAFGSTHTDGRHVLLLGRDADALVAVYISVVAAGGAIATPRLVVPLPVLGYMFDGPVEELAAATAAIAADAGLAPPLPPLEYFSLFLTIAALPDFRLTPDGVVDVKQRRVVAPRRPLDPG